MTKFDGRQLLLIVGPSLLSTHHYKIAWAIIDHFLAKPASISLTSPFIRHYWGLE